MGSEAVSPVCSLLSCLFFLDLSPLSVRPQMACCPRGWGSAVGWRGAGLLLCPGLELEQCGLTMAHRHSSLRGVRKEFGVQSSVSD